VAPARRTVSFDAHLRRLSRADDGGRMSRLGALWRTLSVDGVCLNKANHILNDRRPAFVACPAVVWSSTHFRFSAALRALAFRPHECNKIRCDTVDLRALARKAKKMKIKTGLLGRNGRDKSPWRRSIEEGIEFLSIL